MRFQDPNIARKNALQDKHLAEAPRLPGGAPFFAHIEFNICDLCNRTCTFCPRADQVNFPNRKAYMSLDLYRRILTDLARAGYTGRLSFSGFSEPFLYKGVYDMIAKAAHLV